MHLTLQVDTTNSGPQQQNTDTGMKTCIATHDQALLQYSACSNNQVPPAIPRVKTAEIAQAESPTTGKQLALPH